MLIKHKMTTLLQERHYFCP